MKKIVEIIKKKKYYIFGAIIFLAFVYSSFFAKKVYYEVKFVDGAEVIKVEYLEKGAKITLPEEDPSKDGFKFVGWYLENTKVDDFTKIYKNTVIEAAWNLDN